MGGFRELEVYRRAFALSTAVARSVAAWEKTAFWTVGLQLIRSADSVGANVAEAYGRNTQRDRRRQIFIARGSAYELEHWLATATARDLPIPQEALAEARAISRMLTGLTRHLDPEN